MRVMRPEPEHYVPMADETITHHIAGVVLGWQREGGWSPSGGEDALIAAAFSLDIDTARACLPKGLCDAVELYRSEGARGLLAVMEAA
jgi:hypothetical protein